MPEPLIFGNRSMDTVRRPLCGCFVLSCMVGGIFRKPWVFGDASRLHDLKRPSLFRRDEVPARNTHRPSGFAFTNLKKFLRVPRGVFSKTHPWQGVGQRPTKGEASKRGTPFQEGQGLCTKHRQTVRLRLYKPKKVFEGSKGRFSKNAPWREWDGVPGGGTTLWQENFSPAFLLREAIDFCFSS